LRGQTLAVEGCSGQSHHMEPPSTASTDTDGWQRHHFVGHEGSRVEARAWRMRVYTDWIVAASMSPTPTRIPMHISGPLGAVMARRMSRDLRALAKQHNVCFRAERRLKPRWVELARLRQAP